MRQKPFFKTEPAVPDFVAMEESLLKDWYAKGIVKKYLAKNSKARKKFSFLDGPITANNPMGVHHARGRTYKDVWQRYFTMKGFRQRYQNGFDCQGLWVEVEVEKELGFKNKKEIEKYGVEKFVNQCKARVEKYAAIQTKQSKRLGMWMDWGNDYYTMSDENNYAIWKFLKVCHERNWIYKGNDVVPWCSRCETAISQHEILTEDYKEVVHETIYFHYPLLDRPGESLLVWTTTPWTLPANIAVAVDKKIDYSLVQTKSGKKFWLAKALIESVIGADLDKIVKTVKGAALVGWQYSGPFADLPAVKAAAKHKGFHRVVATDPLIMPLSVSEGTGLVHTSTGTGAEDYQLGKKLDLPVIPATDDAGDYLAGFGDLSGQNAKKHPEIIFSALPEFTYKTAKYSHRYPVCWRCKSELIWKLTDEWYIAMDRPDPTHPGKLSLRKQLVAVAKTINWIPGFGLERELDWLKNMHDWLISKKNRFWGLALPIYECANCGQFEVIGNKEELQQKAVKGWDKFSGHSPHKPWVDFVKVSCSQCRAVVSRIEPVGNPWLDAGIVAFSTLPADWFPADFITECYPGQFKNWFYSLLVMATVLKKTRPFKTVLGFESVVGEDGRAMHKSLGNAIEFNEGAEKMSVDVMRWLYCQAQPTFVLPFGFHKAEVIRRQFFLILWNSYRFFVSLANQVGWQPKTKTSKSLELLDQWILSRLQQTIKQVTKSLDEYYSAPATLALESLITDLSTWYIRRSRRRPEALPVLYHCLVTLCQLLAPFTPYLADYLYQQLTDKDSVHLTDWPSADSSLINQTLEEKMAQAREMVEKIHSQRKTLGIKVRQPLAKATVKGKPLADQQLEQLVLEETNLKALAFNPKAKVEVELDTRLTPDLKAEGRFRELLRQIQSQRKQANTRPDEWINLQLADWPQEFEAEIKAKALVKKIIVGSELKVIRLKKS